MEQKEDKQEIPQDHSPDIEQPAIPEEPEQKDKPEKRKPNKIIWLAAATVLALTAILAISATTAKNELEEQVSGLQKQTAELETQLESLEKEKTDLQQQNADLEAELYELKHGASAQLVEIRNAYEAKDWEKTIELYNTLHKSYNGSDEDKEAKELADKAQKEIDAAKKAEEEKKAAEEKARQEKEAKGYETGITYDQLARNPDKYEDEKVKFTGKVLQILYEDNIAAIRLAVNSDYDQVIYCIFEKDLTSSRILEDDIITIYGTSGGEYSYKAVMGQQVTLPLVLVAKIDQ